MKALCTNPICSRWPGCREEGCKQEWQPCLIDFKKEAARAYPFTKEKKNETIQR